jgi:hypothetical protein
MVVVRHVGHTFALKFGLAAARLEDAWLDNPNQALAEN